MATVPKLGYGSNVGGEAIVFFLSLESVISLQRVGTTVFVSIKEWAELL